MPLNMTFLSQSDYINQIITLTDERFSKTNKNFFVVVQAGPIRVSASAVFDQRHRHLPAGR
jgi:hypothetical protein